MVFGAQVGLHTLAICGTTGIDVISGLVTSNEADRLDSGLVDDEINSIMLSVDDIQDTVWQSSLSGQFRNDHGCAGTVNCQWRFNAGIRFRWLTRAPTVS
jgi:hypothetical protein